MELIEFKQQTKDYGYYSGVEGRFLFRGKLVRLGAVFPSDQIANELDMQSEILTASEKMERATIAFEARHSWWLRLIPFKAFKPWLFSKSTGFNYIPEN